MVGWSLLAVAAAGMLIGMRYRAAALIAASFLTVVAGAIAMWLMDLSGSRIFVSTIYLVLTLQGAYFVGLAFMSLRRLM